MQNKNELLTEFGRYALCKSSMLVKPIFLISLMGLHFYREKGPFIAAQPGLHLK